VRRVPPTPRFLGIAGRPAGSWPPRIPTKSGLDAGLGETLERGDGRPWPISGRGMRARSPWAIPCGLPGSTVPVDRYLATRGILKLGELAQGLGFNQRFQLRTTGCEQFTTPGEN